jgi:hypothetical protein
MKQTRNRKGISFSEALANVNRKNNHKGPGFYRLQEVIDRLDDVESEAFFGLLYDKKYPIRRLWLALNAVGIKVHYNTVYKWAQLHRNKQIIFPNGKVMRGKRS